MRKARLVLLAAIVAAVAVVVAGGASAARGRSPVVGHLYVNDNTALNAVAAFDRHNDGSLTPIDGSPFATGGAGPGGPSVSQGSLQLSADGDYLLAVNGKSNDISVFKLKNDGSLKLVNDSPVPSNGVGPVSIAVHDELVYVANAGAGGSNYTGFTFHNGHLDPIAGSTVPLADNDQPGDVLFNADGTKLVGTRVNTSVIDSFVVGEDGRLTKSPHSPFTAQGLGPFGSVFSPSDPTKLFVSNAHDGANNGTVSAFTDGADGTLTPVGTSPFKNNQTAPCWLEISRDGRYVFAVNTAVSTVSSYFVNADGSLSLLGSIGLVMPGGPFDARLSPDGQVLWVVQPGANVVSAFSVLGGTLLPLPQTVTSGPAGATPTGLVIT